ncbi:hypothetical protein NFI96_023024, partial [Prochilodus magdalenae]
RTPYSYSNPAIQPPAHWTLSYLHCSMDSMLIFITFTINNFLSSAHVSMASKTARVLSLFLTQNQTEDPNQAGFSPVYSTETVLIAVTENGTSAKLSFFLTSLQALTTTRTTRGLVCPNLGIGLSAWKRFEPPVSLKTWGFVCFS